MAPANTILVSHSVGITITAANTATPTATPTGTLIKGIGLGQRNKATYAVDAGGFVLLQDSGYNDRSEGNTIPLRMALLIASKGER